MMGYYDMTFQQAIIIVEYDTRLYVVDANTDDVYFDGVWHCKCDSSDFHQSLLNAEVTLITIKGNKLYIEVNVEE